MKRLYSVFALVLLSFFSQAQALKEQQIDSLVNQVLKTFNVPGIALGIVKDGEIILAKGYGVRSINSKEPVTANTNFGIASNSKAFTTTALGILVDEGKLNWDDFVQKYIPEFKLYDPYVSAHFTIRDLLTHRSGLGLGAGDLMVWPDGHDFTPKDIIHNLQYLKPVSEFRTKYDYDNLLYIVAGEVIERVSGKSWTTFIQERILTPLKMTNSAPTLSLLDPELEVIDAHVPIDGKLEVINKYSNTILDAAGGIYSNVNDLTKWVNLQLNNGKVDDKVIISEKQAKALKTPQTIMPIATRPPYNSLFANYGLGFRLVDVAGKLEVSHTGGLEGIVTQITMLPQLNLGIIVLTNQQQGEAFLTITNTIKDSYLGIPNQNWLDFYTKNLNNKVESADSITNAVWKTVELHKKQKNSPHLQEQLIGTYKDNWFGDVLISKKGNSLVFASKRSPQLTGELLYYKNNSYVVRWNNRYFHADAFVHLIVDQNKIQGFTMLPISPLTDFSYDFQDLSFSKLQ
ncbi:serine hydrolase [Sphingobacterium hungaricum]|uniref:Serine hydrolase n=1 Tax=Sphingobacterium hungaricum TaxID=2082723 RepID=A0A928UZJ6_9SPHI|nr:serine hydrolase [Sphingobacterium hungaricum]MBE8714320.1 serine hydrolase [Sphingobacterium hungaricum]